MTEKGTGSRKSPPGMGRKGGGRTRRVPDADADPGAELEERLRFEELISDLSARFVRVEPAQLDQEIEDAQKSICQALGLDRSTLGMFSGPEEVPVFTHSWATAGVEPNPLVPIAQMYPWIVTEIKRGHEVRFTSIDELPEEASADKETLRRLGPKSNLSVPLQVGGRVLGGLSFGMLREERVWPDKLVGRLRLVAQIFTSALERRRVEEDLRESEAKLALATESAGVGIWAYELQKRRFWTTPTNRAIFGLPGDGPIPLDTFIGLVHPEDRRRVGTALQEALDTGKDVSEEYRIVLADGEIRWISSRGRSQRDASGKADRQTGVSMDITARKLAEVAAARATQEFRAMFDLSAMGIAQVDPATERFVRVNQKFCEITGYSEEELRELTFRDITYPGDPPNDPVAYAKVLAGEARDWSVEKRYRRKDGSECWVTVRGSVIRDEEGHPRLSVAGIADITERRQMMERVERAASEWKATFDAVKDLIMVLDQDFRITRVNAATASFFGLPEDQIVGRHCYELMHGSDGPVEGCPYTEMLRTRKHEEIQLEDRGHGKWFTVSVDPILGKEGKLEGVVHTLKDITERKATERELWENQQLISAVFASLFGHVAVLDRAGTIVAVNDAWAKFASENQGSLDEVGVGANYLDTCRRAAAADDPGADEALRGIEAVLAGTLTEFLMENRCPIPQADRWFDMVVHPLKRPEGGAIITHVDTTGRRQAELEVLQLRQELSHVTRVTTMGEMTASLAHELNQPLTAIRSNAQAALQMLTRGKHSPKEMEEILTDIVNDDRRASDMIRRLRALMKKGDFDRQQLELEEVVREVALLAKADALLRDVRLALDIAPGLPAVWGDRIQLQQLLLNLLMNAMEAVKGTDRREVLIAAGCRGAEEAWVAVADTGPGIAPANMQKVFEPFFTTKAEGMGMGLTICQSIAQAHGGRLDAENASSGGAAFTLILPAMAPEL